MKPSGAPVHRTASILRWNKSPPVRIEVERGSDTLGSQELLQQPPLYQPEKRRISVSFMEPEEIHQQSVGASLLGTYVAKTERKEKEWPAAANCHCASRESRQMFLGRMHFSFQLCFHLFLISNVNVLAPQSAAAELFRFFVFTGDISRGSAAFQTTR